MSPTVARLLKQYAISCIPKPAREKYPGMVADLQRWLKRWWNEEMNVRERCAFRRIAERLGPLPERFKQLARDRGLIVQWPPPPKVKAKKRRDWSKPKSWRHKLHGGNRR